MRGRLIAGLTAAVVGAAVAVPGAALASTAPPDVWSSSAATGGRTFANPGETVISSTTAAKLKPAWQTFNGGSAEAPAVVGGVVYRATFAGNANDPATFVASSARTGARLWSVTLPESQYFRDVSVSGGIAVLPFEGWHKLNGLTAVNLTTHKVLWSHSRPAADPSDDYDNGGPIAVDSGRVYLISGNNDLSAWSLTSGAVLWHKDPSAAIQGIAAVGGRLYTGGFESTGGGLVTYNGSTGTKEWSAPGLYGPPVVAGSSVLAESNVGIGSVRATGCGAATCGLTWTHSLDAAPDSILIGAATPTTFYVAYDPVTTNTGRLSRINTVTGAVQWTYASPERVSEYPVRAGNTVWMLTDIHTVKGWSVGATTSTPLKTITLPAGDNGVTGGIADANGTLIVDIFACELTAYRIPGT